MNLLRNRSKITIITFCFFSVFLIFIFSSNVYKFYISKTKKNIKIETKVINTNEKFIDTKDLIKYSVVYNGSLENFNSYISKDNKVFLAFDSLVKKKNGNIMFFNSDNLFVANIENKKFEIFLNKEEYIINGEKNEMSYYPITWDNHLLVSVDIVNKLNMYSNVEIDKDGKKHLFLYDQIQEKNNFNNLKIVSKKNDGFIKSDIYNVIQERYFNLEKDNYRLSYRNSILWIDENNKVKVKNKNEITEIDINAKFEDIKWAKSSEDIIVKQNNSIMIIDQKNNRFNIDSKVISKVEQFNSLSEDNPLDIYFTDIQSDKKLVIFEGRKNGNKITYFNNNEEIIGKCEISPNYENLIIENQNEIYLLDILNMKYKYIQNGKYYGWINKNKFYINDSNKNIIYDILGNKIEESNKNIKYIRDNNGNDFFYSLENKIYSKEKDNVKEVCKIDNELEQIYKINDLEYLFFPIKEDDKISFLSNGINKEIFSKKNLFQNNNKSGSNSYHFDFDNEKIAFLRTEYNAIDICVFMKNTLTSYIISFEDIKTIEKSIINFFILDKYIILITKKSKFIVDLTMNKVNQIQNINNCENLFIETNY